jgi:hypothetical protein
MRNGILAFVAVAVATAQAPAQGWAEKMFKELSHEFGTQPRGKQMMHKFTLTNIYAVRMEITDIKSGCGCVTASAEKRVLEPRESTTIEVRMDGRRFAGPKTVGVRVTVGPEFVSSAELRISANCRSDVVFNPGEVSFGTVTRGQSPVQTIDVEYAGALAWQVREVIAKDIPYTVSLKELYRRQGPRNTQQVGYRLTVTLKADAPVGIHKHEVYLKTNDPASPTVPVLVESSVQTAVTVSPPALPLGTVKVDTVLIRRVVVQGNRPFRILAVEGMGSGIELESPLATTDAAVQFVTIKCRFAPGKFARELKIKTTLQDTPVNVPIDGEAVK